MLSQGQAQIQYGSSVTFMTSEAHHELNADGSLGPFPEVIQYQEIIKESTLIISCQYQFHNSFSFHR